MRKKVPRVLGLSIGTRKIGMAIMSWKHIDDCKVCGFPGRWSDKKLHSIMRPIKRPFTAYGITFLSLKVPSATHHTAGLKQLIAVIKENCIAHSIQLRICTITELKAHGITEGRKNKKTLVQALGNKYPELHFEARKELANRNRHYTKMFEAIAAELLTEQVCQY